VKIKKEWLNFQSLKVRFYSSEWDSSKRSTLNVLESILCLDINGKIFVKMTIFVILKAKSLDYIYFLYPNNTTLSIFCILLLLLVLLIYYYTTFWIKYQILFSQDMILFLEAYSQGHIEFIVRRVTLNRKRYHVACHLKLRNNFPNEWNSPNGQGQCRMLKPVVQFSIYVARTTDSHRGFTRKAHSRCSAARIGPFAN